MELAIENLPKLQNIYIYIYIYILGNNNNNNNNKILYRDIKSLNK
jgi:hypothetical protein